jgi:predicted DNA-binding transcriptional regulator AlpA
MLPGKLPGKLLKFKDLSRVGVNNYPTLKRWQKDQGFPKGRLLGENTRVWTEEEIVAWWDSRVEQPPPENVKGAGAVDAAPDARKPKPPLSPTNISELAPACKALPNGRAG